ncbi:HD domain-containing protein [Streptomyces sp. SID3343]|uniref:HD domain-containing protein n=1 Tax=Streptomyces sp. SID3343 TaxID=2690260 RepID=UPI00136FBAA6|nr:HD domain-containing protein [Streptomyces sp. SID3343]MYW03245.1 HD domain-containing protein [Streptomyces sp. SID3343]
MELTDWAYELAGNVLADVLPRRWEHSKGVAACAQKLGPMLGGDAELLYAAAVLHDIGYAPDLAQTGFHPLDGARFLRDRVSADERVTNLVAHHSCALLEAEERGLRAELAGEFPTERDDLVDALIYCDMTTTPDGAVTSPPDRVAEIVGRYGPESLIGRFIRRAEPEIYAAAARVDRRLLEYRP